MWDKQAVLSHSKLYKLVGVFRCIQRRLRELLEEPTIGKRLDLRQQRVRFGRELSVDQDQ
jgi:hypothetical protein